MKRSLSNLALISALGLGFIGCVQNQPQSFSEVMYGKTAEESVVIMQKEMKFPKEVNKTTTLINSEIDLNDKKTIVWTYQNKLLPSAENENLVYNQEKSLESEITKKIIIDNCKKLYPLYQNGAKLKVITKWSNGKLFQEYTVDKSVCDNLN